MQRLLSVLLALFVVLAASCGTSKPPAPASNLALRDTLIALGQLKAPEGANPERFAELKRALVAALRSGGGKFTAEVPSGASGEVTDLVLNGSGGFFLEWTYRNKGDYDQNKQVTINDLSALGANLGKTTASPDWLSKAIAADGDGNGEVNVSDITPIGANLLATVTRYEIQTTDTPGDEDSWHDFDEQSFESSSIPPGSALRRFSYNFAPSPGSWYRVVAIDDGEQRGVPSNAVQYALAAPVIMSVTPTSGLAETGVNFSAVNSGGTPTSWSWDFGGGATPNTASTAQPALTLAAAGVYNASVTASNVAGSDTFEFTLTVTNPEPPMIDDVLPQSGNAGAQLSFSAILSGGPVATYAWDFGGGATPNTDTAISPFVTLGSGGIYPAALTVTNAAGSDTFNFDLSVIADTNTPPNASLTGSTEQGNPGDTVGLDASASVDSDGTLAKFEWDLDGNGSFELDSGSDPLASTTRPDPAGIKDVSVRVTDDEGATDEAALTLSSLPPSGTWHITTVHSTWDGIVGPPSLAEINGLPGIVFGENTSSGQIYPTYAYTDSDDASSGWNITWVDSYAPECMSLAEINGTPALAYTQLANGSIRYVYTPVADGSSGWSALQLGFSANTEIVSLAAIEGKPAIAYQGGNTLSYYYSSAADGSSGWESVIVDDDYTQGASLVEVNGKGAIAYNGGLLPNLRKLHFAYNTTSGWQRVALNAGLNVNWTRISLQVVAGTPAVLWGDASAINLAHSTEAAGNSGWSTLETNLTAHNDRSFARGLAYNGHVYSAVLSPQEKVSVGVSANSDGSGKWQESVVDPDAADGVSLAMINGHPAVAYKLKASPEIRYAIYK